MANVKITELTAYTNPASTDVVPIVGLVSDQTKKVTIADLLENAGAGSASAAAFAFDSDSDTGMYRPAANELAFTTGGTGRLFIDSSGNCGIGASSPSFSQFGSGTGGLAVEDIGASNTALKIGDGANDNYLVAASNGSFYQSHYGSGSMIFGVGSTGDERMRISSDGNVGINATNPTSALHVVSAASTTWFKFKGSTSGYDYGTFLNSSAVVIGYLGAGNSAITSGAATDLALRSEGNLLFASNGNSERARIDSSGRLLVGTSTNAVIASSIGGKLQIADTSAAAIASLGTYTDNANGSVLILGKSRSSGPGSFAAVESGDLLGSIRFAGDDGTDYVTQAANIEAYVDGTPNSNDMPGRLVFSTTADGASSPTERLRIASDGRATFANYVRMDGGTTSVPALLLTANNNAGKGLEIRNAGNSLNVDIGVDGSAKFAGSVAIGGTAAANTIDDYEEGTWTPTVQFGGASVGITGTFAGAYTKIGNVVTITYRLTFSSKGTSTGTMTITGLPFSASTLLNTISGFGYMHRLASLQTAGQLYFQPENTTIYPRFTGYNGGNTTSLTNTDIGNDTDLRGGIVYRV